MKILEDKIKKDGVIKSGNVLKVGSFLNHQIDPELLDAMAKEWKRLYEGEKVDKILTIEASGIAMACFAAREFGCPLLFAKKGKTTNIPDDVYVTKVFSFTHGTEYPVMVARDFLSPGERILIIDDFLANGAALRGLIDLCNQAGAEVVGCGISIEKTFQPGGRELRKEGYRIESLAKVKALDEEKGIVFE